MMDILDENQDADDIDSCILRQLQLEFEAEVHIESQILQSARKSSDHAKIDDHSRKDLDSPYPALQRLSQESDRDQASNSPFQRHQSEEPNNFGGDDFDLQSLRKWWIEKSCN